jgi:hypothetical protein
VTHHAYPAFWACYHALPDSVQALADKAIALLKADLRHPLLRFKKVGTFWSARMRMHHSTIGVLWFWIGTHVPCFGARGGAMVGDRPLRAVWVEARQDTIVREIAAIGLCLSNPGAVLDLPHARW